MRRAATCARALLLPTASALLILAQACTSGSPAPPRRTDLPDDSTPGVVESVSCEGLEMSLIATTPTRAGLRAAFGAPDSIDVVTEPNRHVSGVTDSLFVVHYPGLVTRIRKPGGGSDMADHVEITEARYVRHVGLAPGVTEQQVVAVLGEPNERDAARLVYDCNAGANQPVTFHLGGGRVTSVTIDYYVD